MLFSYRTFFGAFRNLDFSIKTLVKFYRLSQPIRKLPSNDRVKIEPRNNVSLNYNFVRVREIFIKASSLDNTSLQMTVFIIALLILPINPTRTSWLAVSATFKTIFLSAGLAKKSSINVYEHETNTVTFKSTVG